MLLLYGFHYRRCRTTWALRQHGPLSRTESESCKVPCEVRRCRVQVLRARPPLHSGTLLSGYHGSTASARYAAAYNIVRVPESCVRNVRTLAFFPFLFLEFYPALYYVVVSFFFRSLNISYIIIFIIFSSTFSTPFRYHLPVWMQFVPIFLVRLEPFCDDLHFCKRSRFYVYYWLPRVLEFTAITVYAYSQHLFYYIELDYIFLPVHYQ